MSAWAARTTHKSLTSADSSQSSPGLFNLGFSPVAAWIKAPRITVGRSLTSNVLPTRSTMARKPVNCIVCHGADGTGKMGPTLVGKDVVYKQMLTDPGMFAILAEPVVRRSRSIAAA